MAGAWSVLVPHRTLNDSRVHAAAGLVRATGPEPTTVEDSARRDGWLGLPGDPDDLDVRCQPVFLDRGVVFLRIFVARFGWGYDVREQDDLVLPTYAGPLDLPNVLP